MHENNIELLCNEAERLLQLNIQLLQKMVDSPDVLMDKKQDDNSLLFDKNRAYRRIEELQGEQTKITRREMVLAVVGTMKAGKSTTINAIVGKEILPNRNRPMTSIPTLIRHVPGKITPELWLNNIEPISRLIADLKAKMATTEGKTLFGVLQQDDEKSKLLNIVRDIDWVKNTYSGEEEIFTCLASLNDLVRLATALDVAFPFEAYKEVQELPVIEVEFSHLTGMENSQGTLTLLDTPGPNEANQPHLQAMMSDQLKKASAVLAVLDYTQMSSEADQQVRSELNDIAKVAAGRLFVLVNKFDQKDRNSDNADTVKQSVPAMLQPGMLTSDRVYPGSSRYAFLANRARSVIKQSGHLSIQEGWVENFAEYAFGKKRWREDITDAEKVCESADIIWQESLFDKLITEVVQAAHAKAAALAVDSAAAKLVQNGEDTNEYLSIRHQGLKTSIEVLKTQIDDLMSDIDNIATCQEKVSIEVKRSMNGITRETKALLEESNKILNASVDDFFKSGKRVEKDEMEARNPSNTLNKSIFSSITNVLNLPMPPKKKTLEFDFNEPVMKFTEKAKAEEFLKQIEECVIELLIENEGKITLILKDIVVGIEKNFQSNTIQAIDKIAGQINARLEDNGFTVNIKFPEVKHLKTNLDVKSRMDTLLEEKSFSETRSRYKSNPWGWLCEKFNTDDWGREDYTVAVMHSVVDIRKIKKAVLDQTKAHFEELNNEIEITINKPLLKEIETFFRNFKGKVEQLRNTLIQSRNDHKSDQKKQEQLTKRLLELNRITPDMLRDSKALKKELEPML